MLLSIGVRADTGDLPGNFHGGFVCPDSEAVVFDLCCDNCLGELSNNRQLVPEIAVERFNVGR